MLDLTALAPELKTIFETYPAGNHCDTCALALATVLRRQSYSVAIVTLMNEETPGTAGFRPPFIHARKPDGQSFLSGQTGFHQVCRVRVDEKSYYIDALSYIHYGFNAVEYSVYSELFVYPDGLEITNVREMT